MFVFHCFNACASQTQLEVSFGNQTLNAKDKIAIFWVLFIQLNQSCVFNPLLLPIGAPNGITHCVPTSSNRLHKTGSA